MVILNIVTNKGKQAVSVPDSWAEISFEQFLLIENSWDRKDPVHLFSIITGIDFETLQESQDDYIEETLYRLVSFVFANTPDWDNLTPPKKIMINGRIIAVPSDIGAGTLGQKVMLNTALSTVKDVSQLMIEALCIYLQPLYHGKYDQNKFNEFKQVLMKAPVLDCYAIARFFLLNPINLMKIRQSNFLKPKPMKTKPTKN